MNKSSPLYSLAKSVSDIAAIVNSLWKDFFAWRAMPEQYLISACEQITQTGSKTLMAWTKQSGCTERLLLDLAGRQEKLQPVGVRELLLQRLNVFFADVLIET